MKYFFLIMLLHVNVAGHAQKTALLFIGTYTDGKPAKGIYVYRLDLKTGKLSRTGTAQNITNPSFLNVSSNGRFLYACTDTKTAVPGSISAFLIDSIHGQISFINKQSSEGANPVYVVPDKLGKFIVAGNYTGGSVVVLPANDNGALGMATQVIRFTDSSINKERQDKAHIHSVIFSPDEKFLYLPDLGSDKIRGFKFNGSATEPLATNDSLLVNTTKGAGPRHMAFHLNGKFAYCVEEMGGAIAVYRYVQGRLLPLQRVNANKHKAGSYSSADIHIAPGGLFLYTSNRGENTIAIFSIRKDGKLTLLGYESTRGDVPRNFCIDPDGRFLLVANQASNSVLVFKRNKQSGMLSYTGIQITVPNPSCLQIRHYGSQP